MCLDHTHSKLSTPALLRSPQSNPVCLSFPLCACCWFVVHLALPGGILTDLVSLFLCWSCAGNHNCSDFASAIHVLYRRHHLPALLLFSGTHPWALGGGVGVEISQLSFTLPLGSLLLLQTSTCPNSAEHKTTDWSWTKLAHCFNSVPIISDLSIYNLSGAYTQPKHSSQSNLWFLFSEAINGSQLPLESNENFYSND